MTEVLNLSSNFYQTPTDTVLQHRDAFYSIQKETTETIVDWFSRVRAAVEHCNFGDLAEFLIIDKFFCGLDDDAKRLLRKTNTWSTEQLYRTVTDPQFISETKIEHRLAVVEFMKIELEDVVCKTNS